MTGLEERYLALGLRLGRHVEGLVDAYYGPQDVADVVGSEPRRPASELAAQASELIAELDAGGGDSSLDATRRRWLRAQLVGLHTTARKQAGEQISYADEVELCYGVRPAPIPEEVLAGAHAQLDEAMPGTGSLEERYVRWREGHAIPIDRLEAAVGSIAEDLRARTDHAFGLPDGEHVDWELVTGRPWSGFNHYLGELCSHVSINIDLPVLSTSLGHLVAHETYPGHHTEHSRKEASLVRRRRQVEETIFLVGTPQCLLAEGLADLGAEVLLGPEPERILAEHFAPLGIRYDADAIAQVRPAGEALSSVRANAAWMLHEDGAPFDAVVAYLQRWALLDRPRAEKTVDFLTDPTWCSYISCYVEGLPLCRSFVAGRPDNFERLLTEQLVPADLVA